MAASRSSSTESHRSYPSPSLFEGMNSEKVIFAAIPCAACQKTPERIVRFRCSHLICNDCIKWIDSGNPACPICSTIRPVQLTAENSSSNARTERNLPAGALRCASCSHAMEANCFCLSCDGFICGRCKESHSSKHHFTVDSTEPLPSPMPQAACQLHRGLSVSIFCHRCKSIVCNVCFTMYHVGHDSSVLENQTDMQKSLASTLASNLPSRIKGFDDIKIQFMTRAQKAAEKRDSTAEFVKRAAELMKDTITRRAQQLIDENNKRYELERDTCTQMARSATDMLILSARMKHMAANAGQQNSSSVPNEILLPFLRSTFDQLQQLNNAADRFSAQLDTPLLPFHLPLEYLRCQLSNFGSFTMGTRLPPNHPIYCQFRPPAPPGNQQRFQPYPQPAAMVSQFGQTTQRLPTLAPRSMQSPSQSAQMPPPPEYSPRFGLPNGSIVRLLAAPPIQQRPPVVSNQNPIRVHPVQWPSCALQANRPFLIPSNAANVISQDSTTSSTHHQNANEAVTETGSTQSDNGTLAPMAPPMDCDSQQAAANVKKARSMQQIFDEVIAESKASKQPRRTRKNYTKKRQRHASASEASIGSNFKITSLRPLELSTLSFTEDLAPLNNERSYSVETDVHQHGLANETTTPILSPRDSDEDATMDLRLVIDDSSTGVESAITVEEVDDFATMKREADAKQPDIEIIYDAVNETSDNSTLVTASNAAVNKKKAPKTYWTELCIVCSRNDSCTVRRCQNEFCARVYHPCHHVPAFEEDFSPNTTWLCTLCDVDLEHMKRSKDELDQESGGMSDYEQKACERILLKLFLNPDSIVFHESVDKSMDAYHQNISHPMDFSIIAQRLTQRQYADTKSFLADLNRVFINWYICIEDPDNQEYKVGEHYRQLVNDYFPELVNEVQLLPLKRKSDQYLTPNRDDDTEQPSKKQRLDG